jgi:hypothetical protein
LKLEIPEVIASLFSNTDWLVCESYQIEVFNFILKLIKLRENGKAFYLIKVLCGPNIPFYLIRGIGMHKQNSDLYPSVIEHRDDQIDEYRECEQILMKMKDRFLPEVYLFTSFDEDNLIKIRLKLNVNEAYNFSRLR